jgi:hypothetical protein
VEPQGIEQVKKYPHLAVFRREAVFVNGRGLTPYQLEDFRYDYDANPRYVYQGYRDPSTMPPGTFAVNDQRTDHPDAGMVFLRLPAGVSEAKARVEIADNSVLIDSKRLLIEVKKSNVVLRNLVVQNSASNYMSAGVGININSFNYAKINNVLIDRCEFNWNNGSGAVIWAVDDVTIKNTRALYNGCAGLFVWGCNKVLLQDSETSYNAWVADLSKNGWDPAGVKALISNSTIPRHKSNYNKYIGMWLDEGRPGNANNTFENCDFSYNQASYEGAGAHGLLFEFASGPQ